MFGQACDCLPDIHQPCLHLSLHYHIPFSFYAKIFLCLSVSPSLPSLKPLHLSIPDITIACELFQNMNYFILIILCQRKKLLFPAFFSPSLLFIMLPSLLSFFNPVLFFPVSWCEHINPVKANGFYLLMGERFSSVLCSLAAPELCYFLWCLVSLETRLASTRAAQDSSLHCAFEWIVIGPLLIITPTHFHG